MTLYYMLLIYHYDNFCSIFILFNYKTPFGFEYRRIILVAKNILHIGYEEVVGIASSLLYSQFHITPFS